MQNKDKDEAPGGTSVQSEEHSWSYAPYLMGKAQAVVCPFPRQSDNDNQDSNNSEELCQIRAREDMSSPEGDIQNDSIVIVETKQQDESIVNVTMDEGSEKLRIQDDSLLDKLESFQNYSLSQTFTLHQSFQAILSDIKQQEMLANGVDNHEASGDQQKEGQTETTAESQNDRSPDIKQGSEMITSQVNESEGELEYAHGPKYESIVQAALMASGISQDVDSDTSTNANDENNEAQRNPKRKRQPSSDMRPIAIVKSESIEESTKNVDEEIPSNKTQFVPHTAYTRSIQIRSETNTVLNLISNPPGEVSKQSLEVAPRPHALTKSSPDAQSSQLGSWQQFMTKYLPNQNPIPPWISVNGEPLQSQPKQDNVPQAQPNLPTECTKMKQSTPNDNNNVPVKLEPKDDRSSENPTKQNKTLCQPTIQLKVEPNSTSNLDEQPKGTSPKTIPKDIMQKITHFGVSPLSESTPILEHHKSRTKLSPLFPMLPETTPEFQRTLKRVALSASPTNLPNNSGILAESTPENHLQNVRSKLSPNNFPDFSGRLSPFNDPFFFPPPAHQNQHRQTSPTNFRQMSPTGYFGMHQPAPAHHGMDMYYGSHNPYPPFYGSMYSNPYQNPMHHNMMLHQNSMYQQQYHHQQMPPPFGIPPYSQQNTLEADDSQKKESVKTEKQHDQFGHPFNIPPFPSQSKGHQHNPPSHSSQHQNSQDPLKQSPRQKQNLDQSALGTTGFPQHGHTHHPQNPESTKALTSQQLHQFITPGKGIHQNPENDSQNLKPTIPDSFGLSLPLQPPASMKLMITPPGLKKQENVVKQEFPDFNNRGGKTEQSQGQQHQGYPMPHSNSGITRLPHLPHHGHQKTLQSNHSSEKLLSGPPQIHHGPRPMNQHPHMPNNGTMSSHHLYTNRPPSVQPSDIYQNSANQINASSHLSNTSTEEPDTNDEHKEDATEEANLKGPPPNNKRKGRINYTSKQLNAMDRAFEGDPYPKPDLLDNLSAELQIPVSKLKVWFQNKRARARKKGGDKSVQPPSDKFNQVYKNLMAFRKPMMMPEHSIPNYQPPTSKTHSTVSAIPDHPGTVTPHPPVSAMSHHPGPHPIGSMTSHQPGSVPSHLQGSMTSHQPGSVPSHPPGSMSSNLSGSLLSNPLGSMGSHQSAPVPSHSPGSLPPGSVTSHIPGSMASHTPGSMASHPPGSMAAHPPGSMASHTTFSTMPNPSAMMSHPSALAHQTGSLSSRHPVSNMSHPFLSGMSHPTSMPGPLRPTISAMSYASMLPLPSLPEK